MGLTIRKLDKRLQQERENAEKNQEFASRGRFGSAASSTTAKTKLSRKRASTRLSLRVASLRQSIAGYRRVKSSTLKEQRYRSDLFARASPNPRFKPKSRPRSRLSKRRVKTQELSIKSDDSDFLEVEARKLKAHSLDIERHRKLPTPPSEPRIKPRYYTFSEKHPFGSKLGRFDVRSENFSALSMSKKELKAAAVEMILCVINEDVIFSQKLFKNKKSRSGRLFSTFSSRTTNKYQRQSSQVTTLRGRLTGGKDLNTSDENLEEIAYESGMKVPTCLSSDVKKAVVEFVDEVEKRYTKTKYHSFKHAVDVTQMMFMLIFFLNSNLSRIQPFTMIVSCLCHDMGHFGANNNFLRSETWTNNRFLERFGKDSPLERFHVFLTRKVMEKSRLFSPEFMPLETYNQVIEFGERLILNTDMDRHAECMRSAEKDVEAEKDLVRNGATEKVPLPESFLILAIKLCDVANVARDFDDAKTWTDLLSREFKALGTISTNQKFLARNQDVVVADYDASLESGNFVISDELSADSLIKYQQQCDDPDFTECSKLTQGFMQTITKPMARLLSEVQQQAAWFLIDRMHQNEQSWEAAIDEVENADPAPTL